MAFNAHFNKLLDDPDVIEQISEMSSAIGIDYPKDFNELAGGYVDGDTIIHKTIGKGVILSISKYPELTTVGDSHTYKYVIIAEIKWENGKTEKYSLSSLIGWGHIEPKIETEDR